MSAGPTMSDADLVSRAMRTLNPRPGHRADVRWVCVMHTFACGSTAAQKLCARFGLNPDEEIKR